MAYQRKTQDIFVIESNYGYGWEYTMEETTRKGGLLTLKEYRENQPEYPHRLIKKREKIEGLL